MGREGEYLASNQTSPSYLPEQEENTDPSHKAVPEFSLHNTMPTYIRSGFFNTKAKDPYPYSGSGYTGASNL